jgi:hypothetical protein
MTTDEATAVFIERLERVMHKPPRPYMCRECDLDQRYCGTTPEACWQESLAEARGGGR